MKQKYLKSEQIIRQPTRRSRLPLATSVQLPTPAIIDAIIANLDNPDPLIANAARWSLRSNYNQLEAVKNYIDQNEEASGALNLKPKQQLSYEIFLGHSTRIHQKE